MNIINKIKEKQTEITRNLMLLELDSRFTKLVNILKQKHRSLDETFLNISNKKDFDWQKYYANLCLFFDQDVIYLVNLYHHHKQDDLSIYDDSAKEINQELLAKEVEIKKCIQDTEDNYHDEVLTNYIKTKYELIMSKFQSDLEGLLKRNEISLINNLTDNYQNVMPLTVYNNATLVKERCLEELSSVLDDFINYVNSLIENKKIIAEKEQLIDKTISKINNQELLAKFNNIKNHYYESITHINSIDTKISILQKEYFHKLDDFYEEVKKLEEIYDQKVQVTNYFTYLKETNPVKIEFSKLSEIKAYLQTNDNYELQKLLNKAYYEIIKLEVRYNNGATYIYQELTKPMTIDLEQLFLDDLKKYQAVLIKNNCYEKFLTSDFNLELLIKFTEIIMPDTIEMLVDKYKSDLHDKKNYKVHPSFKEILKFTSNKKMFDDLGGAVIETAIDNRMFYVTRHGEILNHKLNLKELDIQIIKSIEYHDGIFTCYGYNQKPISNGYVTSWRKTYYIAAYDALNNCVCFVKKIADDKRVSKIHEYSDGLVCVEYEGDFDFCYYYDLQGKLKLKFKKLSLDVLNFNNGYLASTTTSSVCYYNKMGRIVYQEKNDIDFYAKHVFDKIAHSFNHGIALIENRRIPSLTKFVDVNFKRVLTGFKYLKHEVITEKNEKVFLPYLKDYQDDSTYIIEKGKLLPINLNDLANYYLVENYIFGIDYSGNYRFEPKETSHINNFLDILYKICLNNSSLTERLKDDNQDDEVLDKCVPFREQIANRTSRELTSEKQNILITSNSNKVKNKKMFANSWRKIYNNHYSVITSKPKQLISTASESTPQTTTQETSHKTYHLIKIKK